MVLNRGYVGYIQGRASGLGFRVWGLGFRDTNSYGR